MLPDASTFVWSDWTSTLRGSFLLHILLVFLHHLCLCPQSLLLPHLLLLLLLLLHHLCLAHLKTIHALTF
jgi:hypothetical protein